MPCPRVPPGACERVPLCLHPLPLHQRQHPFTAPRSLSLLHRPLPRGRSIPLWDAGAGCRQGQLPQRGSLALHGLAWTWGNVCRQPCSSLFTETGTTLLWVSVHTHPHNPSCFSLTRSATSLPSLTPLNLARLHIERGQHKDVAFSFPHLFPES